MEPQCGLCAPLLPIIPGRLCNNSVLMSPQEPEADPRPYIECTAQNDVVGRKNVTIATGFYQVCGGGVCVCGGGGGYRCVQSHPPCPAEYRMLRARSWRW